MKMNKKVKEQILAVRSTGLTNVFDIHYVQKLAHEMNFYDLVIFIEEHSSEYVHFIFHHTILEENLNVKKIKKKTKLRQLLSKMYCKKESER